MACDKPPPTFALSALLLFCFFLFFFCFTWKIRPGVFARLKAHHASSLRCERFTFALRPRFFFLVLSAQRVYDEIVFSGNRLFPCAVRLLPFFLHFFIDDPPFLQVCFLSFMRIEFSSLLLCRFLTVSSLRPAGGKTFFFLRSHIYIQTSR